MKKTINLNDVKSNPQIDEFIKRSTQRLKLYHYTDHGIDHADLVARKARYAAKEIGFPEDEQELAAIGGFTHDMGNFIDRKFHGYWGALLFQTVFQEKMPAKELVTIMQAITNHDKYCAKIVNSIAAVVILADKSDVRRTRVTEKNKELIKEDIHNRVNFAVTENSLDVSAKNKRITLTLKIDTDFVPVIEYFEIFTKRMVFCRRAADFLGYKFGLVINDFKLL